MNATEDGDEPMGEAPEYVIITAPPPEALTSIPVLGENERQAIAEIRALHAPQTIDVKCCPVDCEDHEDPDDCPDVKLDVCGHCYGLAEEANEYYGEEEGIALQFIYPCETALALAKWGV